MACGYRSSREAWRLTVDCEHLSTLPGCGFCDEDNNTSLKGFKRAI